MRQILRLTALTFALVTLFSADIIAQVDTRFWFVAPETTRDHLKEPGALRVTAFDQPANVTISMPANPDFKPVQLNVPANSQLKHEFGDAVLLRIDGTVAFERMLWTIENGTMDAVSGNGHNFPNDWEGWTAGTPFNKGLLIESDQNISAYYEVANGNNPERFNLKGANALGTEFLIPSQNIYENRYNSSREKIDIVATEDNTVVTVSLNNDHNINGHAAGSTFDIILNKGQTYSLRSRSGATARHLGGTYITSNKPIAITISDDSIRHPGQGHWDLVGDQLVPISIIGTQYVAMHTSYGYVRKRDSDRDYQLDDEILYANTDQKVFIWAATNDPLGTQVSINGVATGPKLARGEFVLADITNNAIYITATAPVYVYQFASFRYELGSAILPAINCTGSRQVTFQKIYNSDFLVQIMTQYKYRNDLIMQPAGGHARLDDLTWVRVPGTGPAGHDDTWYTAVKNFPQNTISTENPYTIRFDPSIPDHYGLFHLSVLDANGASMSYGYFSSYSSLGVEGLSSSCVGNEVELRAVQRGININPDAVELLWYKNDGEQPFHIGETVMVTESDRYYVEMQYPGCGTTNYIDVEFTIPEFDLGGDQELCPGEVISFEFPELTNGETFEWRVNGEIISTENNFSLEVDADSEYEITLTVTDDENCAGTESITITVRPNPVIDWNIGETQDEICLGEEIRNQSHNHRYEWYFNGTLLNPDDPDQNFIVPAESGEYALTVWSDEVCQDSQIRNITVNPLPTVSLDDDEVCFGDVAIFAVDETLYETITWHNGTTTSSITLDESQTVSVTVTNEHGCEAQGSAILTVHDLAIFPDRNINICQGTGYTFNFDANTFNNIVWQHENGFPYTTDPEYSKEFFGDPSEAGAYTITANDINECNVTSTVYINIYTENLPLEIKNFNDKIEEDGFMCAGDFIEISTEGHRFTKFEWYWKAEEAHEYVLIPSNNIDIVNDSTLIARNDGWYKLIAEENHGCVSEAELPVKVYTQPTFLLNPMKLCPGDSPFVFEIEQWHHPSPNQYDDPNKLGIDRIRWLHDPTIESIRIEVDVPVTYTVTAWDGRGCYNTVSATASFYETPQISLPDMEICDNESSTLTISNVVDENQIASYYWSRNNVPIGSGDLVITQGGEYTLTILDNGDEDTGEDGCISSATFTVTMRPSPVFSLGDERPVCIGESITIAADNSFVRYEWGGNTDDDQPNWYELTTPGQDNISLQIWNEFNCTSTSSVDIYVAEYPEVNLPDVPVKCAGETTPLSVPFSYDNGYRMVWTTPSGYIRNESNIVAQMGRYSVRVTNPFGCRSEAETLINWIELPNVFAAPNDIEALCPIDLPFAIELGGDIDQIDGVTWHDNQFTNQFSRPASILDTVNVAYLRDRNNCLSMLSHTVHLQEPNFYMVGETLEACEPEMVVLNGGEYTFREGSDDEIRYDIQEYNWYLNQKSPENHIGNTQTFDIEESGRYIVEVFDGCWVLTDTFDVAYYPSPIINRLDSTIYAQITAFVDGGTMPITYALNDGVPQTSHTFKNIPNGDHILWVEDFHGCETFAYFSLNSTYDVQVPNFFTPNGDGVNDAWIIEGIEALPESIIYVYDRYGKLLRKFVASDPPWDGTYLNRPLPSDDYWYYIHLLPVDKYIRGNVTIIR